MVAREWEVKEGKQRQCVDESMFVGEKMHINTLLCELFRSDC